jgi:hypothetical protein
MTGSGKHAPKAHAQNSASGHAVAVTQTIERLVSRWVRYQAYGLLDTTRPIHAKGRAFYYDGKNLPSTEAHILGLSTPRKVAQSPKHQPL